MIAILGFFKERKDMRKKKILIGVSLIIFVGIFSNVTIPGEKKYIKWLLEEHSISCENTFILSECKLIVNNQKIDRLSRNETIVGIYTTISDSFRDQDGNIIEINSLGVMNKFYNR